MMKQTELSELDAVTRRVRGKILELSHRAGTPHLASSLSCVDILVAAYWTALRVDPKKPDDPGRDRLIFSKGHAAMALYAVLAERGFVPPEVLDAYCVDGGKLAGTGAQSYSAGDATGGSEEAARFKSRAQ